MSTSKPDWSNLPQRPDDSVTSNHARSPAGQSSGEQPLPPAGYTQPARPVPVTPANPNAAPQASPAMPPFPALPNPSWPSPSPSRSQPIVPKPIPVQAVSGMPVVPGPAVRPAQPVPTATGAQGSWVNPAGPTQPTGGAPTFVAQPQSPNAHPGGTAPAASVASMSRSTAGRSARPVIVSPGTVAVRDASDDDQLHPRSGDLVKKAPPWLISTIVHAVLLVILGLIVVVSQRNDQVELVIDPTYAEDIGEQLIDDNLDVALDTTDVIDPAFSEDLNPVEDPFAAAPDVPEVVLESTSPSSEIEAPSIGLALTGREKGMKKALLGAYGGTETTEAAVLRGLEWLRRNQQADGSWSLKGPYSTGGINENRAAATAMALLAFQGAGNTHQSGDFKTTVAKAWNWMLQQQDEEGDFFREGGYHDRLYTQAQCTIAICELYGMTKDPKFKQPAQKALDFAHKAQSSLGGWRYNPRQDSDTSVTGWFVMALQSGMMAGLSVQSPTLDNIQRFLDSVAHEGGVKYGYQPGRDPDEVMTAEALLCRQYLGWQRDDPRLVQGVEYIGVHPIDYNNQNVYYWYYATQVNHHMDGDYWKRWNQVMREAVPRAQVQSGSESGSWSPTDDRWGHIGGRLYTTCLSIYMLEVYYRHMPIYKYRLQ